MNGIDISSWQKNLIVSNLGEDTEFIIVKATGGAGYSNPYFNYHIEQTLETGRLAGAYHYAREKGFASNPYTEAEYFVSKIDKYIGKILLALDWEEDLSAGVFWAFEWLNKVYEFTGIKPLVYTSQSVCANSNWSQVAEAGYGLWLAQYKNTAVTRYQDNPWTKGDIGAFDGYYIHQYSGNGRISGYSSPVDLNKFFGTRENWMKLAKPNYKAGETQDNISEDLPFIIEHISEDMQWAIDMGIFQGYEDGTMRPQNNLTREEAATVLRRLIEKRFNEVI